MTTKDLLVLALFVVGIVLFGLVGFHIVHQETTKYDLVAVGLMTWLIGFTVDRFWKTA